MTQQNFIPGPITQQLPSFIDPPITKITQISAMKNGRYALSRLHDSQLLKTVRHCYEGLTAANCRTVIGSKGLPTDVDSLTKMYVQYNILFGNVTEIEVVNELATLKTYLISNRINHLQRSKEANHKFYNNYNNGNSNSHSKYF
jgi:hypothetical protein